MEERITAWGLGLGSFLRTSKLWNTEVVMVWDRAFVRFPTKWSYGYQFQGTVNLVSIVLEMPCVPVVQHCLISLLLNLSHCMIVSADFIEIPHFLPFLHGSSVQEGILLKKLAWHETKLV